MTILASTPQYSVLANQQPNVYEDDQDAEYMATQYTIASGEYNPDSVAANKDMLQRGQAPILRDNISALRSAEVPKTRLDMFREALTQGDTEKAFQIVTTKAEEVPPNVAVEQGVAEEGITHRVLTEEIKAKGDVSPDDVSFAERMLVIGNFFLEMQKDMASYSNPEYVGDPKAAMAKAGVAFDSIFADQPNVSIPSVWLLNKAIAVGTFQEAVGEVASIFNKDFYVDLLASFLNTPTAGTKSEGKLGKFIFTGDAGREFQQKLVTLPPKELANYLQEKSAYIKEAIGDNPLRAYSVAWDMVYSTSLNNPTETEAQFNIWKEVKEIPVLYTDENGNQILDENGQPQYKMMPNPLYKAFAQGGEGATATFMNAIDTISSKASIQSFVDSPVQDIFLAMGITKGTLKSLAQLRTLVNVMGRGVAAPYVWSRATRGGNVTADVLHHVTSMVSPTSYADPELAAAVGHFTAKTEDMLGNVVVSPRVQLTPEQVAQSTLNLQNTGVQFDREFMWSFHETSEGNNFITSVYGTGKGGGFIDTASAEAWAKQKNLAAYNIIEPTPGSFYVAVRSALDEAGFYSGSLHVTGKMDYIRTLLGLGENIWTPAATSNKELGAAATSAPLITGAYSEIGRYLASNLKGLSNKQYSRLSEILDAGKYAPNPAKPGYQGKWFSPDEFNQEYYNRFGEVPDIKEQTAYFAAKHASDMNFSLMNKPDYDRAASLGVSAYRSESPTATSEFLAKIVPNDSVRGKFLAKLPGGGLASDSASIKSLLNDPDTIVFRLYGTMEENGKTVTHIIGKKGEYKDVGLPIQLMDYTAGGSRAYYERFYLKGQSEDRIYTLGVFSSKKEGLKHKTKIDKAVKIYRKFLEDIANAKKSGTLTAAAERRIRAIHDPALQAIDVRFSTASMDAHIKNGMLNLDIEYHVLFDRQSFPGQATTNDFNTVETSLKQEKGRLYYSKKGVMLFEDGGSNPATLVNPFETLTKQMSHAIKVAGYSDFAIQQMNAWAAKYKQFMTDQSRGLTILDQVFMEGKFPENPLPGITRRQIWLAEAERSHIKRLLGHPDKVAAYINRQNDLLAEKMASYVGDRVSKSRSKLLESLRRGTLPEAQVISALKELAYDLKLGFFNTEHLLIQYVGAAAAVTMHPVYGAIAIMEGLLMWPIMMFSKNQKAIDVLDASAAALKYLPKGEFKKIMKLYKETGMHNVRHSDTQLDVLANIDGLGKGAFWNKTKQTGRTFVYEGERLARLTTFNIARRLADEEVLKGKLLRDSPEYIDYIRGRTGSLTLNMMSGMEAAWSRNPITTLAMQMLQYPIKATEVYLGLNRQLTAQEKLFFMVGTPLLWGSFGIPGGPQALDWLVEKYFPDMSQEEYKIYRYGLPDAFMRNVLNTDTALAQRAGYGDFWAGFIADLTDKSIFEFLGGISLDLGLKLAKAGSIVGQALMSAWSAGQINTTDLTTLGEETLIELGKTVKSFSTWRKAYILENYNKLQNAAGTSVIERNSKYSVLATVLGISSAEEELAYSRIASEISKKKDMKAAAPQVSRWLLVIEASLQDLLRNPNDVEALSKLKLAHGTIAGILGAFEDPEDQKEIMNSAKYTLSTDSKLQNQAKQITVKIKTQETE